MFFNSSLSTSISVKYDLIVDAMVKSVIASKILASIIAKYKLPDRRRDAFRHTDKPFGGRSLIDAVNDKKDVVWNFLCVRQ